MATHRIAEDDLDLYVPEKVAEDRAAPVEEHLLVQFASRMR